MPKKPSGAAEVARSLPIGKSGHKPWEHYLTADKRQWFQEFCEAIKAMEEKPTYHAMRDAIQEHCGRPICERALRERLL